MLLSELEPLREHPRVQPLAQVALRLLQQLAREQHRRGRAVPRNVVLNIARTPMGKRAYLFTRAYVEQKEENRRTRRVLNGQNAQGVDGCDTLQENHGPSLRFFTKYGA